MNEKLISERMRIREKQADITNGTDSPFITMDRRVWLDYADEVAQLESKNKIFPMQDGPPITRKTAEMIYEIYSNLFGSNQSLDRLAARGGFGWAEVKLMADTFIRKRGLKTFNQMKNRWILAILGG